MSLVVVDLRRYPVKSMAGESLSEVGLDARGVVGDRWWAVEDDAGHFASGESTRRFRRHDPVFTFAASTQDGGVVVRSEAGQWRVGDPALDDELSSVLATDVRVTAEAGVPHQDAGSVSIVGTSSIAWCREQLAVDADHRRLRPNVLVETTEPFVEETWVGRRIGWAPRYSQSSDASNGAAPSTSPRTASIRSPRG